VTNTGGCSKADTINVLIKPNPLPIQVISGSKSICENEGFNFEIQNQNGVSYSWTGPSQFTGIGNSIGFKASLLNSGSYKVTTSLNGCPGDSASILLNVKQNPTISLEYNSSVCLGTKTLVTAISRQGASFFWSDNSSLNTGNFGVGQHWVQSSFNGCSVRDTFDINNSGPIAAFVTAPDSIAIVYEKVQFLDKSVSGASPISKWEWKIGEAQIRTEQNPEFIYSTIGEFEIQLIVTDAIGCTDTLKRELIVDKPNKWFIPNLFTPDGDGKNDFFEIGLIDQYPGTSVSIFNRWGEKEFSSKDYKNEFGGKDLLEGVYYYSVKRSDGTEFNGYVYLRRN
jgi:gliding motility-associated-like protein